MRYIHDTAIPERPCESVAKFLLPSAPFAGRLRAHFRQGGLIAYPTESCYGLGCDPRSYGAVRRLLRLKGRPQAKGLILIADTFRSLAPYAAPLAEDLQARLGSTWPGPHTWLVPASRRTPRWLRGRHASIALRVTAHPVAAGLCRMLGSALVSTSANQAGRRPLKSYRDCVRAFGGSVLVVPGRIGARRKPSTIQDLLTGRIIRG
jgi:L-threonylcarbamoyladenylate synthase